MDGPDGSGKEKDQDGVSVHPPCKALLSAPSQPKEQSQVELELRLLQAIEIYPPTKLQGIHRHFILFGIMEYLRRSFERPFSADEVLQLLDRFYNVEFLTSEKPDTEEMEILNQEEEFSLPRSYFDKKKTYK